MSRPCALVIEDAGPVRKLLSVALTTAGWDVLEAEDAQTALEIARRSDPDVVLEDLLLPDADPFALLAELHSLPGWAGRPVVVVSGWSAKVAEAQSRDLPFADFLIKPFSISDLYRAVDPFRRDSPVN